MCIRDRYMGNEEDAFWLLCMIIESILPLDYYSSMIGVIIDQKIFSKLIKKMMPSLYAHLKSNKLDPSLVSLQWFICIFTYNLMPSISDALWDKLFLSGSKILFKAGLAIISLIEKNLLACNDLTELFACLENEPKNLTNVDGIIQTMSLTKYKNITNKYLTKKKREKEKQNFNQFVQGRKLERIHSC
eukprot:TRINITY_DN20380_c0_g1_i4.p2 TRINITY_DN20380_c0_g1~~TRINITY_DN20380_c0_g1_i4.p2  ORF type:complete len:188 (+),score=24.54 TRINITY_DN20380_c0_g1_i4:175-738(+)